MIVMIIEFSTVGSGRHYVAEVKFPFTARSNDELTVTANTIIRLAPKHLQPNVRGWLLAADGDKQGLVPANYIKVLMISLLRDKLRETLTTSNELLFNLLTANLLNLG